MPFDCLLIVVLKIAMQRRFSALVRPAVSPPRLYARLKPVSVRRFDFRANTSADYATDP